jgi:Rap1a immunity proteins
MSVSGYRWTVSIPLQWNAHDNSDFEMLKVYVPMRLSQWYVKLTLGVRKFAESSMSLRLRRVAAFLVLVAGAMPSSLARSETTYVYAGNIAQLCTSDRDIAKSWCEGFISAVIEIITNAPVEGVAACVPPLTNLPQGISLVKKWLAAHSSPQESAQQASLAVARALAEAFPCKSSDPPDHGVRWTSVPRQVAVSVGGVTGGGW